MIEIKDSGKNNSIIFSENLKKCNLLINVTGSNNKIIISPSATVNGILLVESSNSEIVFQESVRFNGRIFQKGEGKNSVIIGRESTTEGISIICSEGTNVSIGKNCMISFDVEIRTSDSHAIFDLNSKERINFASDIVIEDDVWIAAHAKLLKGCKISRGSVVGFSSVVTKKFDQQNIVIVGNPARVVKSNVYWERKLLG